MSRQALVISVLLALALALIGLAVLVKPAGGGPDAPVVRIDPASVREIRVQPAGGGDAEIVQRTDSGGWRLLIDTGNAPAPAAWPLVPSRVRGLLGALARVTAAAPAPADAALERPPLVVTITPDTGHDTMLRFDTEPVGGRVLMEVDGARLVFVDQSVLDVFTSPGPRGWRDTSAMPGVGAETSRLTFRSGEKGLSLARRQGRWFVDAPDHARADDAAVRTVVQAVGSLAIDAFVDDPLDAVTMGLAHPRLEVVAEADSRVIGPGGEPVVTTDRRVLRVGGPASMSADRLFASPGDGRTVFLIRTDALKDVSLDPTKYASRTATGRLPADIGMVVVSLTGMEDQGFRRGVAGWTRLTGAGPAALDDPKPVTELLAFLAERLASEVVLTPTSDWRPVGTIALLDFEAEPLERIDVGVSSAGALLLRSADVAGTDAIVTRVYAGAPPPSLLAIPAGGAAR